MFMPVSPFFQLVQFVPRFTDSLCKSTVTLLQRRFLWASPQTLSHSSTPLGIDFAKLTD